MMNTFESVPSVQDLYTPKTITKLNSDRSLCERVHALRTRENALSDLLRKKDISDIHLACRERIMQMLAETDAEKTAYTDSDPTAFVRSVYDLPRSPFTARMRRRARETARVYKHMCEGSLFVPHDTDGFQRLWELAMEGEPRWSEDYPSSAFRTGEVKIYDSLLGQNVLQVCSAPDRIRPELTMLLALDLDEVRMLSLQRGNLMLHGAKGRRCSAQKPYAVCIDELGRLYSCSATLAMPEYSFGDAASWDPSDPDSTAAAPQQRSWFLEESLPWNDPECRECIWLPACGGGCAYLRHKGAKDCVPWKDDPEGFVLAQYQRIGEKQRDFVLTPAAVGKTAAPLLKRRGIKRTCDGTSLPSEEDPFSCEDADSGDTL